VSRAGALELGRLVTAAAADGDRRRLSMETSTVERQTTTTMTTALRSV